MTVTEAYRVIHQHLAEHGVRGRTFQVSRMPTPMMHGEEWGAVVRRGSAMLKTYGATLDDAVIDLARQLKETTP